MPALSSYLQRRGDVLYFRIAIPSNLRAILGCRELTRTLRTTNTRIARPIALQLAGLAHQLFIEVRYCMGDDNSLSKEMLKIVLEKKRQIQLDRQQEQHEKELISLKQSYLHDIEVAGLRAKAEAFDKLTTHSTPVTTNPSQNNPVVVKTDPGKVPKLSDVTNDFLGTYQIDKHREMYKKHTTVIPIFLELVGDKRVNEIKQSDIVNFFDVVQKLPPRWKDKKQKLNCSLRELLNMPQEKTLSHGTYKDTYMASIRPFLKWAKSRWQDQGFPTTLTTEAIEYRGDRALGENKQRAFRQDELKRLFEGPEMAKYATDDGAAHYYWLPHIGLFTGARVNEICQLNPQTDIYEEGGIWCFRFTEDTPADPQIRKSIKKVSSQRVVPIHSKLIDLGLLDYITLLKTQGDTLIFPDWKPERLKASPKAEKWFRRLLEKTKLRDETLGARLVGMHAFRSTILNRALNLGVEDASHITGHADMNKTSVYRGYEGKLYVENAQRILEQITFDIEFAKRS